MCGDAGDRHPSSDPSAVGRRRTLLAGAVTMRLGAGVVVFWLLRRTKSPCHGQNAIIAPRFGRRSPGHTFPGPRRLRRGAACRMDPSGTPRWISWGDREPCPGTAPGAGFGCVVGHLFCSQRGRARPGSRYRVAACGGSPRSPTQRHLRRGTSGRCRASEGRPGVAIGDLHRHARHVRGGRVSGSRPNLRISTGHARRPIVALADDASGTSQHPCRYP